MSMSTNVVGFRPPDEKWQKMKAVYDACAAAKVDLPDDVEEFFDGDYPEPEGVRVELEKSICCREWSNDHAQGFEIDVKLLPKDVTIIRFYNSW